MIRLVTKSDETDLARSVRRYKSPFCKSVVSIVDEFILYSPLGAQVAPSDAARCCSVPFLFLQLSHRERHKLIGCRRQLTLPSAF